MAIIQTADGGYINDAKWTYTTYDPQSGQLVTRPIALKYRNSAGLATIQTRGANAYADAFERTESNYLGGRANVSVRDQILQAAGKIRGQYQGITQEDALRYANQWVNDRMSKGWDANEIENMMKDVSRGEYSLNNDFMTGVMGMIRHDEDEATPGDTTGNPTAGGADPRGSIQDELRAFAGRMMAVLPPDSPQVQRIAELAQQAGNKYAQQSGMGPGGITATGVAGVAARANVDLQTQREGIGAQALAAAGNQQLSVDQMNTQLQQYNQQAANSQAGGIGGLIGGAAGLIGGGIATAYGANPQIIPGLMQGGSNYGTGIATLASNGSQGPITYGGGGGAPQGSTYKGRSWGTS